MRIFLFRGMFGNAMSTGLDRLAEKLQALGHEVSVHTYLSRWTIQSRLGNMLDENGLLPDGQQVGAIGHSLGGNSANRLAANLAGDGIPIAYVATIDPTLPKPNPPSIRADNFRSWDPRAEFVEGAREYKMGHLNHIEIDKDEKVHEIIINSIREVSREKADLHAQTHASALAVKTGNTSDAPLEALLKAFAGKVADERSATVRDRPKRVVRDALGQSVGKALDGKKTGLGILGTITTIVLPIAFPQLQQFKWLFGALNQGADAASNGSLLLPLFATLTGWGVLDKIEKWVLAR